MICKSCGAEFPGRMVINGKEVWLYTRSYCLKCSPFGERKYKQAKPSCTKGIKQCPICNREFKLNKNDVCSTCRNWYQRYNHKLKAIKLLGGKCVECGNDDWEVLTFHHKGDKDFTFASSWGNQEWQILEEELSKCEILCSNCHLKHHRKDKHDKYLKILDYYSRPSGETGDTQRT